MIEAITNFDLAVLEAIQNIKCGFLDFTVPLITKLGDGGIFWIALAVIFLIPKKTRKMGLAMGFALIFGLIVGNITLKPLIGRIRPYNLAGYEDMLAGLLVEPLKDFSFPSGHTLASFEGATAIFVFNKKLGIPALILASLVALSRLYLFVHYPTDVLAGLILGIAFGILGAMLSRFIFGKIEEKNQLKADQGGLN